MSFKFYTPALIWAMIILLIIAIPGDYIPKAHGVWELISPDKILHLGMFAPLSFFIAWGIFKDQNTRVATFIISLAFGIIYAITTELLQYYIINGRNGNIYDAIADVIGVIIGLLLFHKIVNNKSI